MKSILSLLIACFLFSCSDTGAVADASSVTADNILPGVYSIDSVVSGIAVDINGDSIKNTDLLSESDCYSSGRVVLGDNGSFLYVCSKADVFNGQYSCAEFTYEGRWEAKQQNGDESLIMAFYTDEDGEEQNVMFCKDSEGLHLKYVMADLPDTTTGGRLHPANGSLCYTFKKQQTDIL
ncbi:hypothetical protein [Flavobacterium sp.]|uniref:hypothetical protein n=1 Tax=Flavobacterium sp. TaxID=239 RepID=UPI00262934A0|nr:hypothetical protein [Flavobacterium sp.]